MTLFVTKVRIISTQLPPCTKIGGLNSAQEPIKGGLGTPPSLSFLIASLVAEVSTTDFDTVQYVHFDFQQWQSDTTFGRLSSVQVMHYFSILYSPGLKDSAISERLISTAELLHLAFSVSSTRQSSCLSHSMNHPGKVVKMCPIPCKSVNIQTFISASVK